MQNATLSLVRGDDQEVGLVVATPSGTPYNLSGAALIFTARQDGWYSDVILGPKTVTQHLDATGGLSQLTFVPADTAAINDSTHYFDIRLLSAAGKYSTLVYGDFTVRPQ